jgi:hypothetical protein
MNIPNLPIQVLAVTDAGGANAFFSNDLSHLLITEGNSTADRLKAHFMTSISSAQQKSKCSEQALACLMMCDDFFIYRHYLIYDYTLLLITTCTTNIVNVFHPEFIKF